MSYTTEINRILDKFPDGERRFVQDPYFKAVVMGLYNNVDVYELMNDVLEANFNTINEFQDYAKGDMRETKITLIDICNVCGNKQIYECKNRLG